MAEHAFAGLNCSDVAELAPGFVLDVLTPAESGAVRRHLAECPELHAEMAELHSVVPALFAAADPAAPPPGLKDRILAAAAADLQARRRAGPAVVAPARPAAEPRRGWDLGALFRRPAWAAIAAAAVVLAIALGALNLQLRDQVAGLEAYRSGVIAVLDQAAKPGAQLAVLTDPSGAGSQSGIAAVGADGSIAIVMRDLRPTTGTQVYEAWLIAGQNAPVPIGAFRVGTSGSASFTSRSTGGVGVIVALTLEPGPGATTPTPPIVAAGMAHAQAS